MNRTMHTEIGEGKSKINIFPIYNPGNWKEVDSIFKRIEEKHEREKLIIGGDFNIRIGKLGEIEIYRRI